MDKHEKEQASINLEEGEVALQSLEQDIHQIKWALHGILIINRVVYVTIGQEEKNVAKSYEVEKWHVFGVIVNYLLGGRKSTPISVIMMHLEAYKDNLTSTCKHS